MFRFCMFLVFLFQSTLATSSSLAIVCEWQESPAHTQNFYRRATLSLLIQKRRVIIIEDTFLFRKYEPCWSGGYSSCAFGFDYDRSSDWNITNKSLNELAIEAPGFYWDAELKLKISKNFNDLKSSTTFSLSLSGDDGDGVMFNNEIFSCKVI